MKVEQISKHIWSLQTWRLLRCTVWVVAEEDGLTLVDAGMPFMAKGILAFLEQMKHLGPLKRILLTHGHQDHVGSVQAILERVGNVPVYAHAVELPYLNGEQLYPRRKKLEHHLPQGITQPLQDAGSERELRAVGRLQPVFTPGHSPGHTAYFHEEDSVLLGGDMCTSKRGRLRPPMPMFTGDMATAIQSARVLEHLRPKRLEICHSKPVFNPAEQLQEYLQQNS
ncbi:MBL fold metallo-hydrolase [Tumebacillus flagellatus]|uniref:Hydrolase glyoxylase n=1 Tax=Tumebacillus flagellatus TaxID=1157490 RepID=A0A074LNF3_9BACL|nr:MBL fold metallo-hydrolase [Tumebacillus flagellatus]KEO81388.1 hydrolase glyoxylase [Tumebacillus flagellatus]